MTAKQDFDPRDATMSMRMDLRGDQGQNMALYQSAYEPNDSGNGGFKTDCFPRNFPRNFPDNNGGEMEIPRCWPLPGGNDWHKPSDAQETKAETKLDAGVNGLIPDADKQNLTDANHALLTGDTAGLGAAYAKYKDDPNRLKAFVEEQNRELKDAKSDVGVQMTDDGKIYVSKNHGQSAVEIDPATGETSVRRVMHGQDGDIYVGDKVDSADPEKALDQIGHHAVNGINEPDFKFGYAMQYDRMKTHFKHAFLINAQDQTEAPASPDQDLVTPPNPQTIAV
ncbi:hypothetical protein BH10CYA1_BH10CYA1_06410 [soil metagenome]